MTEPEVSLYIALYYIRNGLTTNHVMVSIDGAHVKTKDNVHFDIWKFFAEHEFIKIDSNGNRWQGEYKVGEYDAHIIISSNPGKGDVNILTRDGRTIVVESKKGKSDKRGQEYPLMREAIGQLMTGSTWFDTLEPVVAVPYTEKSKELADRWSVLPQIKKVGIKFFLIKEDGDLCIVG